MNSIMLVIAMNTCTISNQIDTQPPEQYLELLLLEVVDDTSDSICVNIQSFVNGLLGFYENPFRYRTLEIVESHRPI
jgi:hypothetical protein